MVINARRLTIGSVVIARFGPIQGMAEVKERPCIVHQVYIHPESTVTVIPLTSTKPSKPYPFLVAIPKGTAGLKKDSWAKCMQVQTIAVEDISKHIGDLSVSEMRPITSALLLHLGVLGQLA